MADFACEGLPRWSSHTSSMGPVEQKRHNLLTSGPDLLCEGLHISLGLPYRGVEVFRHDIHLSNPLQRCAPDEHHVVRSEI